MTVRFSSMSKEGVETDVKYIKRSDMLKCPHCIMMPEHYRNDGSCKCNDPLDEKMAEWGYSWNPSKKVWV